MTVLSRDPQMSDQRLVEDRVDDFAVVVAPVAPSPQPDAVGRGQCLTAGVERGAAPVDGPRGGGAPSGKLEGTAFSNLP